MPIQQAPLNPPTDALPPIPVIPETPPNILAATHGTRTRIRVRAGTDVDHDDYITSNTWFQIINYNHQRWTIIRQAVGGDEAYEKEKVRRAFAEIYQAMAEHQHTYIVESEYPYFATQRLYAFWGPILATLFAPFALQFYMEDNGRRTCAFWCDVRDSRIPHASEMDAAITAAFQVA
jgi:hypothetical protein